MTRWQRGRKCRRIKIFRQDQVNLSQFAACAAQALGGSDVGEHKRIQRAAGETIGWLEQTSQVNLSCLAVDGKRKPACIRQPAQRARLQPVALSCRCREQDRSGHSQERSGRFQASSQPLLRTQVTPKWRFGKRIDAQNGERDLAELWTDGI